MSTGRVELSGGVLLTVGFGSWEGKSQIKEKQGEETSMLGLWPDAGKRCRAVDSRYCLDLLHVGSQPHGLSLQKRSFENLLAMIQFHLLCLPIDVSVSQRNPGRL